MRFSVLTVIFFLCWWLLTPLRVFAQTPAEFTISLESTYVISSDHETTVKNEIRIKNNYSTMYSTQFALEVGSDALTNILVYDNENKEITPNVTQTEKRTTIALQFEDKIIGKDKERVFTIEYKNPDSAIVSGKVLEVDVPKLSQQSTFQNYVVHIHVPHEFGKPSASAPAAYTTTEGEGETIYTFSSPKNGINLLFGEKQYYSFTLKYHLNNPSISQGVSQIALPPDTSYQRITYTAIDPKPDNVQKDEDGNWIATFTVDAQKTITVTASGIVALSLQPTPFSETNAKKYLVEQPYWDVKNPQIMQLAQSLKTPRAIYDYIVQSYSYDYQRLANGDQLRRGAATALQNPTAVLCQEFTDTFIALARAAGIPAREVNGFAYTENPKLRPAALASDLLHAWPEYYDAEKKLWIQVDPTWGNTTNGVDFFTKLDFNHIAFVIHGSSSEKPYTAGMYKVTGQEGKDVEVQLATAALDPVRQISLTPPTFLKPNTITFENQTGAAWYDVPVTITPSQTLSISGKATDHINFLPYEKKELEIPVRSSSLFTFTQRKGMVTVTIGDETIQYETTVGAIKPGVAVGIGFAVCTIIAGCVLVFRRKR